MEYVGFWRRFGAGLIDMAITLPLVVIAYFGKKTFHFFELYWIIPSILFELWFCILLVKRYGGTPGKRLLKIRITMLDGSAITLRSAILRYSIFFIFSILNNIFILFPALNTSDDFYRAIANPDKTENILLSSFWYISITIFPLIWIIVEAVVMMCNKKRRSIHDFIATTVVVRDIESNITSKRIEIDKEIQPVDESK